MCRLGCNAFCLKLFPIQPVENLVYYASNPYKEQPKECCKVLILDLSTQLLLSRNEPLEHEILVTPYT